MFSIYYSNESEKRSKSNFDDTQDKLKIFEEKMGDTLNEIQIKASVIDAVVKESMKQNSELINKIVSEIVIPKPVDPSNEVAMALMGEVLKNPSLMSNLIDVGEKMNRFTGNNQTKKIE